MSFFDEIKTALGLGNQNDDDYEEDYGGGYEPTPVPGNDMPSYQPNIAKTQSPDDRGRLNISVTAQLQVILVKPEKFADTKEIANHLNNKKTVVLNLEATTPDVTRRIIDFLGGVAYANGGSIKPVANNTFIITPYNVGFQGDELSAELESNGVLL